MIIQIICIGKLSKIFHEVNNHYLKMIKWTVNIVELKHNHKADAKTVIQLEEEMILRAMNLNIKAYNIVLDTKGSDYSSHEFSQKLDQIIAQHSKVNIIIGGAFGISARILCLSNLKIKLSHMTLTHQFARMMLLEQLYRAQTIRESHPYHK